MRFSKMKDRLKVLFLWLWAGVFHCLPAQVAEGTGSLEDPPSDIAARLIDPLTVEKTISFVRGERLVFKLGWSLFSVARSELEVQPMEYQGKPALSIQLNTRTNSFADAFYKVRNLSSSIVDRDLSWSYEYNARQLEGSHDRDIVAYFDPQGLTGRYVNRIDGSERPPVEIMPGTFDPLGIVFFVRSLDLAVGDEHVVPTSNGKEFFYTVVRVVKKVNRKFAHGRYDAFVLEPDIKDLGGVFKKSPDGRIRIFLSADERKLPLRMESEVAVGSFWAELVEILE